MAETPRSGECRYCHRRRLVYSIRRSGGGNYRRPNRSYRSSICGECAVDLVAYLQQGSMTVSRFDGYRLREIAQAEQNSA